MSIEEKLEEIRDIADLVDRGLHTVKQAQELPGYCFALCAALDGALARADEETRELVAIRLGVISGPDSSVAVPGKDFKT